MSYIIIDKNTNTKVLSRDFPTKNMALAYLKGLNANGRTLEVKEIK